MLSRSLERLSKYGLPKSSALAALLRWASSAVLTLALLATLESWVLRDSAAPGSRALPRVRSLALVQVASEPSSGMPADRAPAPIPPLRQVPVPTPQAVPTPSVPIPSVPVPQAVPLPPPAAPARVPLPVTPTPGSEAPTAGLPLLMPSPALPRSQARAPSASALSLGLAANRVEAAALRPAPPQPRAAAPEHKTAAPEHSTAAMTHKAAAAEDSAAHTRSEEATPAIAAAAVSQPPSLSQAPGLPRQASQQGAAPAVAPPLVSALELDRQLRPVQAVRPRYPAAARRRGRAGTVQLQVEVAPSGEVTRVDVVEETAGWGFGDSAVAAYAVARFAPPTAGGRPVRVLWHKTLYFRP